MSDAFRIPDTVLSQELAGDTVLLHLDTGTYFGLDPLGTRVWRLLQSGRRLPDIRETLLKDYDVAPARLDADLRALMTQLRKNRLVSDE